MNLLEEDGLNHVLCDSKCSFLPCICHPIDWQGTLLKGSALLSAPTCFLPWFSNSTEYLTEEIVDLVEPEKM